MGLILLICFLVLLSSALCSGTEAALFSISEVKTKTRAQEGDRSAIAGRPIATIVILNNIANITGSMIIGKLAADKLGTWEGFFMGVFTFMVIICAEIIPKTIGEKYNDPLAFWIARPVLFITWCMTFALIIIELFTWFVRKSDDSVQTTNESEIKMMASIGSKEGAINHNESVLISKVLDMDDVTASAIMTPRVMMTSLNKDLTLGAAREHIISSTHSRIILIGEDADDVIGIVYKTELLVAMVNQEFDKTLQAFNHKVKFVPEQAAADKLLRFFQSSRIHIAIVIDQYSGVSGVVSLEDVLECLTGEIVDETDVAIDLQRAAKELNINRKTQSAIAVENSEKAV
jgi:CBS domain containing-hemolysin-like protein